MKTSVNFVSALLAFFLPPAAVFMQVGLGIHFWINLILSLLGGIPGQLHAFWVIASNGPNGQTDPEAGSKFVALLLAYALPPVAVAIRKGVGVALLINLVLCVFFWLPAILHALDEAAARHPGGCAPQTPRRSADEAGRSPMT